MIKYGIYVVVPGYDHDILLPGREYDNYSKAQEVLEKEADNTFVHIVAFKKDKFTLRKVSNDKFVVYNREGNEHCSLKIDIAED